MESKALAMTRAQPFRILSTAPTYAQPTVHQPRRSDRRGVRLNEIDAVEQVLHAEEGLNVSAEVPRHAEIGFRIARQAGGIGVAVSGGRASCRGFVSARASRTASHSRSDR